MVIKVNDQSYYLTNHAFERMLERKITTDDLIYVIKNGEKIREEKIQWRKKGKSKGQKQKVYFFSQERCIKVIIAFPHNTILTVCKDQLLWTTA